MVLGTCFFGFLRPPSPGKFPPECLLDEVDNFFFGLARSSSASRFYLGPKFVVYTNRLVAFCRKFAALLFSCHHQHLVRGSSFLTRYCVTPALSNANQDQHIGHFTICQSKRNGKCQFFLLTLVSSMSYHHPHNKRAARCCNTVAALAHPSTEKDTDMPLQEYVVDDDSRQVFVQTEICTSPEKFVEEIDAGWSWFDDELLKPTVIFESDARFRAECAAESELRRAKRESADD